MWKNDRELLSEVILIRAFDYLANHSDLSIIHYLETQCGPVMTACIAKYGLQEVHDQLELKILDLK